ncbi:MAG: CrcB family protein [Victivallaceae bacterium]|nr:CrcB family protein [Victivallaceae bacterium]
MKMLLLIGAAGFVGTVMRYCLMRGVNHLLPGFPWGTFAVNIIGAYTAGFCFVLCRARFPHYESYFPILFVGFLGAFTTFSTFALESVRYFLDAQYMKFAGNVLLQNSTGLLAAVGGIRMAQMFFKSC